MRKQLTIILLLLSPILLWAQNDEVVFSHKGGVYADAFSVALSCQNPTHHIRYTLNGATPDASARLYTNALQLDRSMVSSSDIYKIQVSPEEEAYYPETVMKAIVIRAAVFDASENRVSKVITQSYFIKSLGCEIHDLPVVSICADSLSLFSYDTGIMVQGAHLDPENPQWTGNYYENGREWERCINVEYYAIDNKGFNQQAGLRTHGGNGRRFAQKSFKIYAREEYGKKRFKYKIFDDCDVTSFKHLVLKPFKSAWTQAGLQNYLTCLLARNFNLDQLACRPVVLFLNGEYWGIYFVQEKPDERYLENHYDVDPETPNIISNWFGQVDAGQNTTFLELMDFASVADLSCDEAYRQMSEKIDIDNFIDYQIYEIWTANVDWPANNMRCWQVPGQKWRWFFFDGDACLQSADIDSYLYATDDGDAFWPSNATSTLLFRALLKNDDFRKRFLTRLKAVNQSLLNYDNTKKILRDAVDLVKKEIPNQVKRFNFPVDVGEWEARCLDIDDFLRLRQKAVEKQTKRYFNLSDDVDFVCYPNPSSNGWVNIRFVADDNIFNDVVIYDINGKCVFRDSLLSVGGEELPVSHQLSSGVYVLKIGPYSKKIVVL